MQDFRVQSLGPEDPLEKGTATHSSVLAWRIPQTEQPGRLYSPWGHKESDMTEQLTLLEKEMATHSSILAWRIPWTEELGGLQSTGRKESDMTATSLHFKRKKEKLLSRVWLCDHIDCSPHRLLRPWDFPSKITGVGFNFLLQGIFPTQGSNPGLLHCRQMLYRLSHQGSHWYSPLSYPKPVPWK